MDHAKYLPQDVESVRVALCEYEDHGNECEDDSGKPQSLLRGLLIQVESVSYCQAERTKRRIAGCDREYDNAEKRDDALRPGPRMCLHTTPMVAVARESVSCLKAQVVNAHGAGCPYHCDEAFQDHHVVECHAALFLALHRTGDDRRLGGVESGEDAAGHRDEEDRDKVVLAEICTVQDASCIPSLPRSL